jgi:precorrin-8X/cobalt-precorrin-8 methylmutase
MFDYIRDPAEIYRRSFETIRAEADLSHIPDDLLAVVMRMIHASGSPDIVADLAFSPGAGTAGRQALEAGVPILADSRMVAMGISKSRLPAGNAVFCTLNQAKAINTTRTAAAVELWKPHLKDAVVAIGNAPTALFRLLELLLDGADRPALILGFPVGFVGAAESKEALIGNSCGIPFLTLRGRRGGSALAASAVNALGVEPE